MSGSILIAGIGNIFNRDDAFGVCVASKLAQTQLPPNVRAVDFGIRGFDLVMALLEGFDLIVFVDAVSRGGTPGTVYVIEHESAGVAGFAAGYFENAHGLDPLKVLDMARSLGAQPGRVLVVGCEPETLEGESGRIELSAAVESAVPVAIETVRLLIEDFNQRPETMAVGVEGHG